MRKHEAVFRWSIGAQFADQIERIIIGRDTRNSDTETRPKMPAKHIGVLERAILANEASPDIEHRRAIIALACPREKKALAIGADDRERFRLNRIADAYRQFFRLSK